MERRRLSRFFTHCLARVCVRGVWVEGTALDLSQRGCFVATGAEIPEGEVVALQIRVGKNNFPIVEEAIVTRIGETTTGWGRTRKGFGVQFVRISPEAQSEIARHLGEVVTPHQPHQAEPPAVPLLALAEGLEADEDAADDAEEVGAEMNSDDPPPAAEVYAGEMPTGTAVIDREALAPPPPETPIQVASPPTPRSSAGRPKGVVLLLVVSLTFSGAMLYMAIRGPETTSTSTYQRVSAVAAKAAAPAPVVPPVAAMPTVASLPPSTPAPTNCGEFGGESVRFGQYICQVQTLTLCDPQTKRFAEQKECGEGTVCDATTAQCVQVAPPSPSPSPTPAVSMTPEVMVATPAPKASPVAVAEPALGEPAFAEPFCRLGTREIGLAPDTQRPKAVCQGSVRVGCELWGSGHAVHTLRNCARERRACVEIPDNAECR